MERDEGRRLMTRTGRLVAAGVVAAAVLAGCSSSSDTSTPSTSADATSGSSVPGDSTPGGSVGSTVPSDVFLLTSTAFADAEPIPLRHACVNQGGENLSPPLAWPLK